MQTQFQYMNLYRIASFLMIFSSILPTSLLGQNYLNENSYTESFNTLYNRYEIKNSRGEIIATRKYNSITQVYDIEIQGEKSYREKVQTQEIEPYIPDWALLAQTQKSLSEARKTRFNELMDFYHETKYYLVESFYLSVCFNEQSKNRMQMLYEKINEYENEPVIASFFSSDLTIARNYDILRTYLLKYNKEFLELYSESLLQKYKNKAVFDNLIAERNQYFNSVGAQRPIPNGEHEVVAFVHSLERFDAKALWQNCRVTVEENTIKSIKLDGQNESVLKFIYPNRISRAFFANNLGVDTQMHISIFFVDFY